MRMQTVIFCVVVVKHEKNFFRVSFFVISSTIVSLKLMNRKKTPFHRVNTSFTNQDQSLWHVK